MNAIVRCYLCGWYDSSKAKRMLGWRALYAGMSSTTTTTNQLQNHDTYTNKTCNNKTKTLPFISLRTSLQQCYCHTSHCCNKIATQLLQFAVTSLKFLSGTKKCVRNKKLSGRNGMGLGTYHSSKLPISLHVVKMCVVLGPYHLFRTNFSSIQTFSSIQM